MVSFSQCLYGQSVAAFCGKGKNKNTASSDRRRGGAPDLYSSGAHNADALLDVISVLDLIDHGNGIVCIGDNGLSAVIEDKLLAALQVLPGLLSVRLEIPGGADGSPLHIVSLPELSEGLCHCRSKGLEGIREVLSPGDGCRVCGIDIERTCAAHDKKPDARAGEEMRQRGAVLGKGLLRPCAEGIDDGVKSLEILPCLIKDVLSDVGLCLGGILFLSPECGDITSMSSLFQFSPKSTSSL